MQTRPDRFLFRHGTRRRCSCFLVPPTDNTCNIRALSGDAAVQSGVVFLAAAKGRSVRAIGRRPKRVCLFMSNRTAVAGRCYSVLPRLSRPYERPSVRASKERASRRLRPPRRWRPRCATVQRGRGRRRCCVSIEAKTLPLLQQPAPPAAKPGLRATATISVVFTRRLWSHFSNLRRRCARRERVRRGCIYRGRPLLRREKLRARARFLWCFLRRLRGTLPTTARPARVCASGHSCVAEKTGYVARHTCVYPSDENAAESSRASCAGACAEFYRIETSRRKKKKEAYSVCLNGSRKESPSEKISLLLAFQNQAN